MCAVKPFVSFSDFNKVEFALATIETDEQLAPQCRAWFDRFQGQQLLVVSNVVEGHLFPLIGAAGSDSACLSSREGHGVIDGASLSIGSFPKEGRVSLDALSRLDIRVGQVVSCVLRETMSFNRGEVTYDLKVDFGDITGNTVLVDSSRNLQLLQGHIVCILNLQPECIHDIPLHPLCYKNTQGENVPLQVAGNVPTGTVFKA